MSQSDAKYHTDDSEKAFNEDEKITNSFKHDPFTPLDGLAEDNENILTFRAIAVGVVCGALVNASNIYLGLISGWTTSANLFAVCSFLQNVFYLYNHVLTTENYSHSLATHS